MTIVIMFKDGRELRMKCESFKTKYNAIGQLASVEYEKCSENVLVYLDTSEVMCIYRVFSDEVKE